MVGRATVACLWLAICQVGTSYVSVEMNRTIQNLLQYYKIRPNERFNGKPVFNRDLPSSKTEAKMVYMGGVLESYEKLIGHMIKQLPTSSLQTSESHQPSAINSNEMAAGGDVRTKLDYLLKKVQELRKHRYQEQEKVLHGLQALHHIQMDNLVVQSKALWELPWLYEEASSLPNNMEMRKRRRRRQAQLVKANKKKLN